MAVDLQNYPELYRRFNYDLLLSNETNLEKFGSNAND